MPVVIRYQRIKIQLRVYKGTLRVRLTGANLELKYVNIAKISFKPVKEKNIVK